MLDNHQMALSIGAAQEGQVVGADLALQFADLFVHRLDVALQRADLLVELVRPFLEDLGPFVVVVVARILVQVSDFLAVLLDQGCPAVDAGTQVQDLLQLQSIAGSGCGSRSRWRLMTTASSRGGACAGEPGTFRSWSDSSLPGQADRHAAAERGVVQLGHDSMITRGQVEVQQAGHLSWEWTGVRLGKPARNQPPRKPGRRCKKI
jgi:hypothetical protein